MNAKMEKLYTLIGQSIADTLPKEWKTAQVDIEIKPGVITAQAYYVPENGGERVSFNIDFSTARHFKALHRVMAETPKGNWKSARLEINKEGHFEFSFVY